MPASTKLLGLKFEAGKKKVNHGTMAGYADLLHICNQKAHSIGVP